MLRDQLGLNVLALDSSETQTRGAARMDTLKSVRRAQNKLHAPLFEDGSAPPAHLPDNNQSPRGSLTYVTAKIDTPSLLSSIDAWLDDRRESTTVVKTPVLFTALHACGSLTPDILRAFVAAYKDSRAADWRPCAAVVVGCCYNMLRSPDLLVSELSCHFTLPELLPSHLQLAAQVPSEWLRSDASMQDASEAIKKLRKLSVSPQVQGTLSAVKLGKLPSAAYQTWDGYMDFVYCKLGQSELYQQIAVFHVMRCILGPVVETLLLMDRLIWMRKQLLGFNCEAELMNVFNQAMSSGRNIAMLLY
ncbi:uncharacterized protein BXZ73DRAFT_91201 [Epithele typhae]|uniref:uncharacterized protein n=1 Tax=Epithele typhae TaxID=378194 RepID=UPI002007A513|nr:uncharacterized protein BXZ73DRAFT_91201 [Epithele typhae]KAH9924602.1 hypothetical protein BXZ73DRAFT_91201 [Epithele typhae]